MTPSSVNLVYWAQAVESKLNMGSGLCYLDLKAIPSLGVWSACLYVHMCMYMPVSLLYMPVYVCIIAVYLSCIRVYASGLPSSAHVWLRNLHRTTRPCLYNAVFIKTNTGFIHANTDKLVRILVCMCLYLHVYARMCMYFWLIERKMAKYECAYVYV